MTIVHPTDLAGPANETLPDLESVASLVYKHYSHINVNIIHIDVCGILNVTMTLWQGTQMDLFWNY